MYQQEIVVTSIGQAIQYTKETCVFVSYTYIFSDRPIYTYIYVYSVVQRQLYIPDDRRYLTFFLSRKFTIKIRSDNLICFTIRIEFFFQEPSTRINFCQISIFARNVTQKRNTHSRLFIFSAYLATFFLSMTFDFFSREKTTINYNKLVYIMYICVM